VKDNKWAIFGVVAVFVGVAVAAIIVSKPETEPDLNVDIAETTNDNETSLEVTDGTDSTNQQEEQVRYLEDFDAQAEPATELQIIDLVEGDGEVVEENARVTVHYTGAYAVNGEIFETSKDRGQTITFGLNEVIPGWTQGVPGMKVGGTRRLIIPGELAYGAAPNGYVPGEGARPLGTLVFDIELEAVEG